MKGVTPSPSRMSMASFFGGKGVAGCGGGEARPF